MENSISTFMLIIATILIGLSVFAITSVYVSQQYANINVQNQAENIANGLYISYIGGVNDSYSLTVYDYNYQDILYFTVFYVPSVYENNTQYITPQFAYRTNGNIIYPKVDVNYITVQTSTLYFTNLNLMYEGGNVTLWKIPSLKVPVPVVIVAPSIPNYNPVIIFFSQTQNKYIEVGYAWL